MPELDGSGVGDYFERRGTVERWWTPEGGPLSFHYDAELEILDDHLGVDPSWRVLDVGTGRGRFGAYFARRGCRVVGVDVNSEMLEEARRAIRLLDLEDRFQLEQASVDDLSRFGAGAFDVVSCMELFDHLPDLGRALGEMKRTLKPDGRFLFTYVPSESLYGRLGNVYRFFHARLRRGATMISRTYSHREVQRRLEANGLELERYWGIGVFCLNAQTRLFVNSRLSRALTALARAEARRHPYYDRPLLARRGAHVVGLARPTKN
jgi:cyclopropane fatty-acyl-phospholipid synthase-like methyltransferase